MSDYNQNPTIQAAISGGYQKTDPTRFCYTSPKNTTIVNNVSKNLRINYVIATWSGARRQGNEQLQLDPVLYIKKHLAAIDKVSHHLNQITLVVPHNPAESPAFTAYIEELEGEGKVVVLRRPNEGQSYGSWISAYQKFNDFDFYIFVEDDYAPLIDDFDSILISLFQASPNCGYLCTRVDKYPPTNYLGRPHAAISNGITSKEILDQIFLKLGEFKYGKEATALHSYAATPQLQFSWTFLDAGYWLYDYANHYSAPYYHVGKLQCYGETRLPALFFPLQLVK